MRFHQNRRSQPSTPSSNSTTTSNSSWPAFFSKFSFSKTPPCVNVNGPTTTKAKSAKTIVVQGCQRRARLLGRGSVSLDEQRDESDPRRRSKGVLRNKEQDDDNEEMEIELHPIHKNINDDEDEEDSSVLQNGIKSFLQLKNSFSGLFEEDDDEEEEDQAHDDQEERTAASPLEEEQDTVSISTTSTPSSSTSSTTLLPTSQPLTSPSALAAKRLQQRMLQRLKFQQECQVTRRLKEQCLQELRAFAAETLPSNTSLDVVVEEDDEEEDDTELLENRQGEDQESRQETHEPSFLAFATNGEHKKAPRKFFYQTLREATRIRLPHEDDTSHTAISKSSETNETPCWKWDQPPPSRPEDNTISTNNNKALEHDKQSQPVKTVEQLPEEDRQPINDKEEEQGSIEQQISVDRNDDRDSMEIKYWPAPLTGNIYATFLQRVLRKFLAQCRYQTMQLSARRIQECWRGWQIVKVLRPRFMNDRLRRAAGRNARRTLFQCRKKMTATRPRARLGIQRISRERSDSESSTGESVHEMASPPPNTQVKKDDKSSPDLWSWFASPTKPLLDLSDDESTQDGDNTTTTDGDNTATTVMTSIQFEQQRPAKQSNSETTASSNLQQHSTGVEQVLTTQSSITASTQQGGLNSLLTSEEEDNDIFDQAPTFEESVTFEMADGVTFEEDMVASPSHEVVNDIVHSISDVLNVASSLSMLMSFDDPKKMEKKLELLTHSFAATSQEEDTGILDEAPSFQESATKEQSHLETNASNLQQDNEAIEQVLTTQSAITVSSQQGEASGDEDIDLFDQASTFEDSVTNLDSNVFNLQQEDGKAIEQALATESSITVSTHSQQGGLLEHILATSATSEDSTGIVDQAPTLQESATFLETITPNLQQDVEAIEQVLTTQSSITTSTQQSGLIEHILATSEEEDTCIFHEAPTFEKSATKEQLHLKNNASNLQQEGEAIEKVLTTQSSITARTQLAHSISDAVVSSWSMLLSFDESKQTMKKPQSHEERVLVLQRQGALMSRVESGRFGVHLKSLSSPRDAEKNAISNEGPLEDSQSNESAAQDQEDTWTKTMIQVTARNVELEKYLALEHRIVRMKKDRCLNELMTWVQEEQDAWMTAQESEDEDDDDDDDDDDEAVLDSDRDPQNKPRETCWLAWIGWQAKEKKPTVSDRENNNDAVAIENDGIKEEPETVVVAEVKEEEENLVMVKGEGENKEDDRPMDRLEQNSDTQTAAQDKDEPHEQPEETDWSLWSWQYTLN